MGIFILFVPSHVFNASIISMDSGILVWFAWFLLSISCMLWAKSQTFPQGPRLLEVGTSRFRTVPCVLLYFLDAFNAFGIVHLKG